MTSLFFNPFVGEGYVNSPIKLFVLGESHYGSGEDQYGNLTKDLVDRWTRGEDKGERWGRTFTAIAAALRGCSGWEVHRETAFESIAFMNFCQRVIMDGTRRPDLENWSTGLPAFRQAVQLLNPTHIWVAGQIMGRYYLPFEEDIDDEFGFYRDGPFFIPAVRSRHPSRYFSSRAFHAKLSDLFALQRKPVMLEG